MSNHGSNVIDKRTSEFKFKANNEILLFDQSVDALLILHYNYFIFHFRIYYLFTYSVEVLSCGIE